jgi:glycosyltransferase involved in cell wall biosynthesis
VNVHQILSGASQHDAITHEACQFRQLFGRWGWKGGDHAARVGRAMSHFQSLARLDPHRDDVLLIHFSAAMPQLETLLELSNPKLLVYHNITPAEYLWDQAPLVAGYCALGRRQLPDLVRAVDVAAAHSAFNARELASLGAQATPVIPVFVDLSRLGPYDAPHRVDGRPPHILFVGRLSPHKGQDELIRVFGLYRQHHAPEARLLLVGSPVTTTYTGFLHELAQRCAPGAVRIESNLSPLALGDRYRSADAFVCLPEHEGFCVPLLEAFQARLPVIARPSGAIPEVAGDAALLVEDRDPAAVAELIHLVVSDEELRHELVRRGLARLEVFTRESIEAKLRMTIEATAEVAAHR